MDLLKKANRRGMGDSGGGVCGEKGNQVGAFWGVKRGLAGPSGREAGNMWGHGGRKVKFGISVLKRKLKASF